MSRILFAWELGAGYGHMSGFLPVALKLRERGHEVLFALKELAHAEEVIGRHGFDFLQAPVCSAPPGNFPAPNSYAEILRNCGFWSTGELLSRVKAWRKLYELTSPDLLVVDHAPTALLAGHGLQIPKVLYGLGFFSPPRIMPLPNLRPWLPVPERHLVESEKQVLLIINDVLSHLDVPALHMLADLFDVEEDVLCTFPEFDHYQNRGQARYWGPRLNTQQGEEPVWPGGESPRIFAYLHGNYGQLESLLGELRKVPGRFLVHVNGAAAGLNRRHQSANVRLTDRPVDLSRAFQQCDMVIGHGGQGTTVAALLAGRPVLLLPMHLEQFLASKSIPQYQAGIVVHPEQKRPAFRKLIKQVIDDTRLKEGARRFAEKYAHFNVEERDEGIVKRFEEIVSVSPCDDGSVDR